MATPLVSDATLASSDGDGFSHSPIGPFSLSAAVEELASSAPSVSAAQRSPRAAGPPPNPPFVFPARPPSSSAPSSFSRATGRRPRSAIDDASDAPAENDERRPPVPPLPIFSFNPAAGLSPPLESPFLSPPLSPQSPRTISTRPGGHGHRRGGSEFVGGKIRDGDAVTVMSVSPTKAESGFASPGLAPADPSGRKGHRHRRSAALSGQDLSKILQPTSPNPVRGSSAPTSPLTPECADDHVFPTIPTAMSSSNDGPSALEADAKPESEPTMTPSPPASPPSDSEKPTARARVGFSDTLEFIPRPLSLVSSDTSSTATARPSHSVSGSISSIISATSSTIADRGPSSPIPRNMVRETSDSRPITAGAVLERTPIPHEIEIPLPSSPRRRNSIPVLASVPDAMACEPPHRSPTKVPKRWSFFGLEPFTASSSPARSPPLSAGLPEPTTNPLAGPASSPDNSSISTIEAVEEGSSEQKPPSKTRNKKQKKRVKMWPGSILTRKSKQRHPKHRPGGRRAPTPPSRRRSWVEGDTDLELPPGPHSAMPTLLVTEGVESSGDLASWQQPRRLRVPEDDSSYPMIDLDAALGPFNTPLPRDPEWEAAQRASGLMKRPLHSAAGMSRFTGPGMHYQHRRAESAPEMVPFEAGRFGIPRFGSSSTMADVFEEDEEEEDGGDDSRSASTTPQAEAMSEADGGLALAEIPAEAPSTTSTDPDKTAQLYGFRAASSGQGDDSGLQNRFGLKAEPPGSALQEDIIMEEPHDAPSPGKAYAATTDAEPLYTSSPSPRQAVPVNDFPSAEPSPLTLPTPSLVPISPYSMTHSSSFPSPRSPMSCEVNRTSTAPSSVTEDNFHSLLMGEPGPEVRISADDVPSLTSSNSTMTRESNFRPQSRPNHSLFGDQPRPASFTSAAFGRRRSSLASLSRLISTSYGERSKLSVEITMDGESEKRPKVSKTKRLSRMMQFWKPKEKTTA